MCTISWCTAQALSPSKRLDIFFNRDESKLRSKALLPEVFEHQDTRTLYPIDPQGGGTWISVNEYGLVLSLLNFYQGRLPKGRLLSRGQIVKDASSCRTFSEVKALVSSLELSKYAPFSLLCFDPEADNYAEVPLIRWNGKDLAFLMQKSPLISSLFDFEAVFASREKQYFDAFESEPTPDQLLAFHRSHKPEASAYSVCMHREDAQTVSLSHISLALKEAAFNYYDGSPCTQQQANSFVLERRSYLNDCAFA